jgi:hypothetical protein
MAKKEAVAARGVVITQEMRQLMGELDAMIDWQKGSARKVEVVRLNESQWKCLEKDRKRKGWKVPRNCGAIDHYDDHSEYKGFRLVPVRAVVAQRGA